MEKNNLYLAHDVNGYYYLFNGYPPFEVNGQYLDSIYNTLDVSNINIPKIGKGKIIKVKLVEDKLTMCPDYNWQNLTKRRALVTLSNGSKVMMDFYLSIPERTNYEHLEAEIVKNFQKSQPNAKNKMIKVHLMRN